MQMSTKTSRTARSDNNRSDAPPLVPAVATGAGWRLIALAALTAALIGASVMLAAPYLPAITWSLALAIISWPLHLTVRRWVQGPSLAAAISSVVVLVVILVPVSLLSYQVGREAASAAQTMKEGGPEGVR